MTLSATSNFDTCQTISFLRRSKVRNFATERATPTDDLIGSVARSRLMLVVFVDFIRLFAGYPEIVEQMIVEPG